MYVCRPLPCRRTLACTFGIKLCRNEAPPLNSCNTERSLAHSISLSSCARRASFRVGLRSISGFGPPCIHNTQYVHNTYTRRRRRPTSHTVVCIVYVLQFEYRAIACTECIFMQTICGRVYTDTPTSMLLVKRNYVYARRRAPVPVT